MIKVLCVCAGAARFVSAVTVLYYCLNLLLRKSAPLTGHLCFFLTYKDKSVLLPWDPVLSMKLLRLNSEVLEAKYWINLCRRCTNTYEQS